ncbi:MAG: adenylate/guanylate cyclase domain-containing protein [Chromatiales bacterium]
MRLTSLWLGLMIGLLGALLGLLPLTADWEEGVGLGLLFKLRGQLPAPKDVVIVSINGETAAQLGLGEEIPQWPRTLHAELIDLLRQAGVAVIAIDIFFKKPRNPKKDALLAASIARAGNVLLVGYLNQERIISGRQILHVERLIPPIKSLSDAAAGVAPFVLPKIPVRVSRFWSFNNENTLPSLPVMALYQLADPDGSRMETLLRVISGNGPHANKQKDRISLIQALRGNRALREKLSAALPYIDHTPAERKRLQALLALCGGEAYPYLNFYGPPSTLTNIPYQRLLKGDSDLLNSLRGKAVFIGYAGDYQPRQRDGFYTIFTQKSGLDLSGVEIAATAFANLLHNETITPLGPSGLAILLLAYGLAVTLLLRFLPGSGGVAATLLLAVAYLGLTYGLFTYHQIWLPWFIPLGLQTPLAMILVLTWHYRQMRHSREQLRELFGYYLPGEVIDRLAEDKEQAMEHSDKAFGVCLATDARRYTSLAERMDPEALQAFLNRYYEILFAPVRSRGGVVSDVIGDAMLAIWPAARPDPALRQKACEAALEITRALQSSDLDPPLPTGIGLHAGELVMSHVGAIDHFEYRAVGDMVNTASRIEALNKMLCTRILASEDMLRGVRGILTRELGAFRITGRTQTINLHEIAALEGEATPELRELHRAFAEALAEWEEGNREQALSHFEALRQRYPDDGPTAYYIQQYHERRGNRINPLS